MNEKDYRMDEELSQFERDLKSLTPRRCSATASVPTMSAFQDNRLTPQVDTSVVMDHQSSGLPFTNGRWLKTVAVSWATGLAAGLLVSAIWTKLMKEEGSITAPSLLTENRSAAGVSESNTPSTGSENSSSKTISRQQPSTTEPLTAPSLTAQRGSGFAGNMRRFSFDSPEQEILHPFMGLNNVNWNAAMKPSSKRFAEMQSGTKQDFEQSNAPDSASGDSQKSFPISIPKTQGQRELLKSLIESNDLISI